MSSETKRLIALVLSLATTVVFLIELGASDDSSAAPQAVGIGR